jgi:rubrerythrin
MVQEKTGEQARNTSPKPNPAISKDLTIEQALDMIDNIDAKDALKAKLRLMHAETERRIHDLQHRYKGEDEDGDDRKRKASDHWTVIGGKPIKDPDGEYDTFAQAYAIADLEKKEQNKEGGILQLLLTSGLIGGGKSNNDQFQIEMNKLMFGLITAMIGNQGKDNSTPIMQALQKKIEGLEKEASESKDPVNSAARLASTLKVFQDLGLVPAPRDENVSVDRLREENRHQEELRRLDAEVELKESLGRAVESIPTALGEGVGHAMSGRGERAVAAEQSSPNVKCPKCGTGFYVPADISVVKCPKCGLELERPKPQPRSEAPQAPPLEEDEQS